MILSDYTHGVYALAGSLECSPMRTDAAEIQALSKCHICLGDCGECGGPDVLKLSTSDCRYQLCSASSATGLCTICGLRVKLTDDEMDCMHCMQ